MAKFYLVSAFLGIVPTLATASFGVKFHRHSQSVFNRAACFVAKFYCRPRSVQSPLVYRKTPAKNKARHRSSARLLPRRRRAVNFKILNPFRDMKFCAVSAKSAEMRVNFKISPALLCSKISPKFYSPRCKIRSFIQNCRRLAQNSRDKIYAAFYGFVISVQHLSPPRRCIF